MFQRSHWLSKPQNKNEKSFHLHFSLIFLKVWIRKILKKNGKQLTLFAVKICLLIISDVVYTQKLKKQSSINLMSKKWHSPLKSVDWTQKDPFVRWNKQLEDAEIFFRSEPDLPNIRKRGITADQS